MDGENLSLFQRFLKMCTARCGQLLNMTSLANDCGVTHKTIGAWLSVLEAGYVIFLLQPYHRNFGKRLVKTPKLYFHDTGLAKWMRYAGSTTLPAQLVYGGDNDMTRQAVEVRSWRNLQASHGAATIANPAQVPPT